MSWDDDCWSERERLVYIAQMNRLYHRRQERFFATLDRWSKALALIAGSAAASALLATDVSKAWAGFAVASVTLPSLVFAWSDRARLHSELAAEYVHLESTIEASGILDWPQIDALKARLVAVSAKEPPELASLLISCQNELAIAAGQPENVVKLGPLRRWFKHVFSMPLDAAPEGAKSKPAA